MPNHQEVFPIGRACWFAVATVANANYDGTGSIQPMIYLAPVPINQIGHAEVTGGKIVLHSDTTEIINILMDVGQGWRVVHTESITAVRCTTLTFADFVVPRSANLAISTVGGDDASGWLFGDIYGA